MMIIMSFYHFSTLFLLFLHTSASVMQEVVLLEQPQSAYVVKSRPTVISCKALNAKTIRFKCNNKWLDETRYENVLGTDPTSQLPYLETSVEISRQEVDTSTHLEDFSCQCYASGTSDEHVVRSDTAKLRIAYMRKHFVQSPTNERVAEGSTLQLLCQAPESDPKATISWLKNGQLLERYSDSNLIYGNDGSLIFSAVRLSDSGNYTCEATNLANKRATDPAVLNVFVNGDWSEWSSWNGICQVNCELLKLQLAASPNQDPLPRLHRTRTCNNPPPLNGGSYCTGSEEEQKMCDIPCRIDGKWSTWSEWSACTPTCHRFRTRTCSMPLALNGGAPCSGRDLDTEPCNEGYCRPVSQQFSSDLTLYGGMTCVAVLLLVIMALCSALLCKRNRGKKTKGANNNIYYAESGAHVRRVLLDQNKALLDEDMHKLPHGSQFFSLGSTCSPSPLHPSMTLRSAKSGYSGYSANRNVGSRAALITECSSSNSSSGGGRKTLIRTSSNCSEDENYATLYDYLEEKSVSGLESSQAVLAASVDASGARLQLRRSGASLLIPENAIDVERMIFMAVSDQISEQPLLKANETVLSPIVHFGECEADTSDCQILLKPIVVSFRHCASVFPRDNWVFTLYADYGYGWQAAVTLGEENLNSTMHIYMEPPGKSRDGMGWCHVMTESFSRLVLVGRARRSSLVACKRVHLAVYGPDTRPEDQFELRVYCVPETGAAMESVNRQEERGRLIAESEHFVLNEKGDLCFSIDTVANGFELNGPNIMEIHDTDHNWCSQNGLHCCLSFDNTSGRTIEEFFARLSVYQKSNPSESHQLQLRFENSIYDKTPSDLDKTVTTDFHLPADLKEQLGALLDKPTDADRDWRGLAKKLHFDRYLQFFGTRPGCSPTVLLLDLWEASECGSLRARHDLLQYLRVMGRPDAVLLLEQYLANFSYVTSP